MSWTLYTHNQTLQAEDGRSLKLTKNEVRLLQAVVERSDLNKATVRASEIDSSRARVALSRLRSKMKQRGWDMPVVSVYGTKTYRTLEPIKIRDDGAPSRKTE